MIEQQEPPTIRYIIEGASQRLTQAGVEQAKRDARLLLGQAFSTPGERFFGREDERLDASTQAVFEKLVDRRFAREPVSRILGARGFWTLDFEITSASLDPRPDSESLVEAVLDLVSTRAAPLRVLDLGTGTGCLLLSVLAEFPLSTGVGSDISSDCVALATRNASANGIVGRARFQCGDWSDGINDIFDVIMCNPPYIPTVEIPTLAPEVAVYEPVKALDGGADGLDCYRRLSFQFPKIMAKNSHIFLEIGRGQRAAVTAIMDAAGLQTVGVKPDLAGHDRCLIIKRRPSRC